MLEPVKNNNIAHTPHHKKKGAIFSFILSGVCFVGLILFIVFISPLEPLKLSAFSISPIPLIMILISFFLFFGTYGIFRSLRHAILVPSFVLAALLLRLNNLTEPLFFFLLLGVFLMIELLLRQKQ